jgi:hypothetical protein
MVTKQKEVTIQVSKNMKNIKEKVKDCNTFKDVVSLYIGQKLAIMAARYQYRGFVAAVLDDCVILSNAYVVESSGPATREKPETEDDLGGSAMIKFDAIEVVHQCRWVFAKLPGEDED